MSSGYPGIVQYHLGQLKQKPLPTNLKSYVITVAPRISAFNEIYKRVQPNGGYYKYNWWKFWNAGQKQFLGFVSRQETAIQPWYSWNYYPFIGLFPNMDTTRNYFKKQNIQINNDKTGNSLVLRSTFNLTFKNEPIKFNDRLYFTKGFSVLRQQTIDQDILYRFDTTNPKVKLWVQENKYIQPKTGYEPLYFYLNYNDQRPFYWDITDRYTSVSLPLMNFQFKEDTEHLNGMYLERINNCTSEIERIQIKNVLQYTDIKIDSNNKGYIKFDEVVNKNYDINSPFMMWLECQDIRFFPLFIGFFNKELF